MSQFSIIKFGFAGEIAGANMPPPPEMPMGCQRVAWATELAGMSPLIRQSPKEKPFKREQQGRDAVCKARLSKECRFMGFVWLCAREANQSRRRGWE